MAYSITTYTGTGSQANWTFAFPYLEQAHVFVTVNGNPAFGAFVGPNTLQIIPTPALGTSIVIFRNSVSGEPPVNFTDGSVLLEKDLDKLTLFALYAAQESADRGGAGGSGGGGVLTMPQIIDGLQYQLTLSAFALSLAEEIGLISAPTSVVGSVAWSILQETNARNAANDAYNANVNTLSANLATATASLVTEAATRASADLALAATASTLSSTVNNNHSTVVAAVTSEAGTRASADTAIAATVTALTTTVTGNATTGAAAVVTEANTRATADTAIAASVTALTSTVTTNASTAAAAVVTESETRAAADTAIAGTVTTTQAAVTGLTTRMGTVETSAAASVTALGVVNANTTIKVQARADGKLAIAGIGLNATATGTTSQSEVILMADKLQFVTSGSGINSTPQVLLQAGLSGGVNTLVLPATRYGDQTIASSFIVDGAITARKMTITGLPSFSVWQDTGFQDPSAWSLSDFGVMPVQAVVVDGVSGGSVIRSNGGTSSAHGTIRVPVTVGRQYRLSMRVRRVGAAIGTIYLRPNPSTSKTGAYSDWSTGTIEGLTPTTSWVLYSSTWTANQPYASPMVILDYNGSAVGYHEAQDIRIEELVDSALVVIGGISADRIDTRGLSIKDLAGNVIFAAGTSLDFNTRFAGSTTGLPANGATVGATWGTNITSQPADTDVLNTHTQGNVLVVNHPAGANASYNNAAQVGAIKVRLPQAFTDTMLRFFVEVYEYATGKSFTVEVGGYTAAQGAWLNTYAKMTGSEASARVVRFGHDGTKCCVWIGEPGSTWEYPQVTVTNLRAGYNNFAESQWKAGWEVTLDTSPVSAHSITASVAKPVPGGAMSGIDQLTAANASTYIASAAIGWAQIGDLTISTNGAIKSGQNGYDSGTGYWMGMDGGVPKMSMGNSAKGFTWDGTTFAVRGNIIATTNMLGNAVTQLVAGSFAGSGRVTLGSLTNRTTTVTVGAITTSAFGDGRVMLIMGRQDRSLVSSWEFYAMSAEATLSSGPTAYTIYFYVKRNGTVIYSFGYNYGNGVGPTLFDHCTLVVDAPGAGVTATYTYEVVTSSNAATNHAHQILGGNYALLEFKK